MLSWLVQGVQSIKKTELKVLYVHIKPPSLEVLEERLRARKTDTEEAVLKRLEVARKELEYGTYWAGQYRKQPCW